MKGNYYEKITLYKEKIISHYDVQFQQVKHKS